MNEESNIIVNTLGDRLRFYEKTFEENTKAARTPEQLALQLRLKTLRKLSNELIAQIGVETILGLDISGLKAIHDHINDEIIVIMRPSALDNQVLVEEVIENLSMADVNNLRFHPEQVRSGEIDYSNNSIESRIWPVGRMKSGATTGPVTDGNLLLGKVPTEIKEKVIIEPQKRTDEAPEHEWAR